MALQKPVSQSGVSTREVLGRVVLINLAIVMAMLALTVLLGVAQAGPSYSLVPDPAAELGLPF